MTIPEDIAKVVRETVERMNASSIKPVMGFDEAMVVREIGLAILAERTASAKRFHLTLEPREDGGLRVWSDDIPGLRLSHNDPALVMADVWPAIKTILGHP